MREMERRLWDRVMKNEMKKISVILVMIAAVLLRLLLHRMSEAIRISPAVRIPICIISRAEYCLVIRKRKTLLLP